MNSVNGHFQRRCRHFAADLPAVVLMNETVIKQRGKEFTLFAPVDPETRHLSHAMVALSRSHLTIGGFSKNFPSCTAEHRRSS